MILPVSIKGVVIWQGQVPLLWNDRGEWELPGGRLEPDESPERCLVREIGEELGIETRVERILDCWRYRIHDTAEVLAEVLIVTYLCRPVTIPVWRISDEHCELRLFALDAVAGIAMPEGYKRSVAAANALSGSGTARSG